MLDSDEVKSMLGLLEQQRTCSKSFLNEEAKLPERIEGLRASYKTSKPFSHCIIDGLFSNDSLERLVDEMDLISSENWVHHEHRCEKLNLRSPVELGETGSKLIALLHSASFLYLLSEVTGIWNLLPDPYLQGGGYHLLPPGGYFDVHVDRNTAYITGLVRRLGLIIYLNKSWQHEYGGQLELWNADATRPEVVVEPIFNRTILFEIGDRNYHGVPNRVACPAGRSRNSFVAYYHTVGTMGRDDVLPHNSIYAPTQYRSRLTLASVTKAVTPPILWRGFRWLKGKEKKSL